MRIEFFFSEEKPLVILRVYFNAIWFMSTSSMPSQLESTPGIVRASPAILENINPVNKLKFSTLIPRNVSLFLMQLTTLHPRGNSFQFNFTVTISSWDKQSMCKRSTMQMLFKHTYYRFQCKTGANGKLCCDQCIIATVRHSGQVCIPQLSAQ